MRYTNTNKLSLPAIVSIARVSSNVENPEPIRIRIEDAVSRLVVAEVSMSLEQFAEAVTGRGQSTGTMDLYQSPHFGWTRAIKTVVIPGLVLDNWAKRAEVIAPYEVDGWKASRYESGPSARFNHHRRRGESGYEMAFERWIPPEETSPVDEATA